MSNKKVKKDERIVPTHHLTNTTVNVMKPLDKCRGCNARRLINPLGLCKRCNRESHKYISDAEISALKAEREAAAAAALAQKLLEEKEAAEKAAAAAAAAAAAGEVAKPEGEAKPGAEKEEGKKEEKGPAKPGEKKEEGKKEEKGPAKKEEKKK
jgi:hypothetical protein